MLFSVLLQGHKSTKCVEMEAQSTSASPEVGHRLTEGQGNQRRSAAAQHSRGAADDRSPLDPSRLSAALQAIPRAAGLEATVVWRRDIPGRHSGRVRLVGSQGHGVVAHSQLT